MFARFRKAAVGVMSYAATLFAMRVHGETGVFLGPNGQLEVSAPNNAALWPPHRMHPTRPRNKKGKGTDRFRMAVIDGRVTIAERTKLVGGKGLRP